MAKSGTHDNSIAQNKKARFTYFIEDEYEAGLVLEGWEVKSLRAGKVNITDAHILVKRGEALLLGAQIQPLPTASLHQPPDVTRTRKLLLHRRQLDSLTGLVERSGYTIVPLAMYWVKNRVKIKIAVARGKKLHDKRDSERDREWRRQQSRIMKRNN